MVINLAKREDLDVPFPSFKCEGVLSNGRESDLLNWFKGDAPWKLKVTDFYQQYEFSLRDIDLPKAVNFLVEETQIEHFQRSLCDKFQIKLQARFDATVHKLVTGQVIKIHNDYIPDYETHRILIQVNEGWSVDNGGLLLLFSKPNPEDVAKIILPVSGTAFGFEISEKSFHAVSTIDSGERYTLVYSFYREF